MTSVNCQNKKRVENTPIRILDKIQVYGVSAVHYMFFLML